MIEFDPRSNTLIQSQFKYSLQDVEEPNLYRQIFTYDDVPKCAFNHRRVPMVVPNEMWLTDTTFRDGQQSREPYTVEQISTIYDYLHKLGGKKGKIKQCEFFIYSEKDREAVYKCLEKGYEFPEITTWIRATKSDFLLAKDIGIKETGILVSCSDFHIFKKLKKTRKQAMEHYISVIREAFECGISPRCHFEDITRADFYGFVVPFAIELKKISNEYNIPVKIRACDTMGYGVTYPGAAMPRSVQGIMYGLSHHAGIPNEWLEWHGHNDFYKAVSNSATAWLFGASAINCSLFGIGERTGNTPLEAMAIEYAQIRGTTDGMDLSVITEIAEYYKNEIGYDIPSRTPFVGKEFNVTKAGIHADGLLKNEEIYNIFNTDKILNRPATVAVNQTSGLAGIAHWLNTNLSFYNDERIDKKDEKILYIKDLVDNQYDNGRITAIGDDEMMEIVKKVAPELL